MEVFLRSVGSLLLDGCAMGGQRTTLCRQSVPPFYLYMVSGDEHKSLVYTGHFYH